MVFLIDSSAWNIVLLDNGDVQRATMANKVVEWSRGDQDDHKYGVPGPWKLFLKQQSLVKFVKIAFTVGNKANGLPEEVVLLPRLLRHGVASFEGIFRFSLDSPRTGEGTLVLKLGKHDLTARMVANTRNGVGLEVGAFLELCRGRYAKRPVQWAQIKAAERKMSQAIFILKTTAAA